jgi:cephalosporin hydroxylase
LHFVSGNSIDESTFNTVKSLMKEPGPVMVDIDSCHDSVHTLKEMILYGPLVTIGSYMISEDTSATDTWWSVEKFLELDKSFVSDRSREKLILTNHPTGWLKKVN